VAGQVASSAKLGSRLIKGAQKLQKSKALNLIDKIHHAKFYQPAKTGKVAYKNITKEETS